MTRSVAGDRRLLAVALAAFTVALVAAGCLIALGSPQEVDESIPTETPQPPVVESDTPTAWPTATAAVALSPASQWITPTATTTPSSTHDPTPTATPTATPTLPPMPPMETILLLGSDQRDSSSGGVWLTDAIMIVTLDAENKRVGMFGIPRDLWVSPPTMRDMRVNQVDYLGEQYGYPGGGPALLADTLREMFGLEIDHYVRFRQAGFVQAIDAIGGVTIVLGCPLQEFAPADPGSEQRFKELYLDAGTHHLDGKTALKFITYRYRFGDWGRAKRQQMLLVALRAQALQLDILPKIPRLYSVVRDSVESDLTLIDWLRLANFVLQIDPQEIHGRVVDETMTEDLVTESNGMALSAEMDAIMQAIETLFDVPASEQFYGHTGNCPPVWPSPTPTAEQ